MWWPCSQIMQGEYGVMPWYENAPIYRVMRRVVVVECEISIESHTQGFNVIGEGNLGASDSRCRN